MYANYFKQGKKHLLVVSATSQPTGKTIEFKSKKDARAHTKENKLIAWNF